MKKGLLSLTLAVSSILIGGVIAMATSSAFAQSVDTEVSAAETGTVATATDTQSLGPFGMTREEHDAMRTQVRERTAEKLGVTVEQMDTARMEARDEVFAENGIDLEALKADRIAHMTERFQEMVDAGRITQEEMDQRLQDIADGEGFGMHGGSGHGHGPMGF